MFRYIAAIVAIAPAPRNVAADFNPARLRLHGTPETDFHLDVDPATLFGAAKTSTRELSSTIVWSAPEAGLCQNSTSYRYRHAYKSPIPTTPSLEDWCKAWCNQVEPDKVVGMEIGVVSSVSTCRCLFSDDDRPSLPLQYNPAATGVITAFLGAGCITGTFSNPNFTCYRNCAYKQCVNNASGYTSCPITTTTTTAANTSKSGKPSSPGTKAGKGSNPMLLAAEGSFSMPTEFNEWGDEFNEWGDIVSMSMENEESTIGV